MNRRMLIAALAALMLMNLAACGKKTMESEPTDLSVETTMETIPGVVNLTETIGQARDDEAEETIDVSAYEDAPKPTEDHSVSSQTTNTGNQSQTANQTTTNNQTQNNQSTTGKDTTKPTEATKPTNPTTPTTPSTPTTPTDPTTPSTPTTPTTPTTPSTPTDPTTPTTSTTPTTPLETLTEYEKYNAMSGEEQMAYMQSFDSVEAFFAWYNSAKAEYEAAHPDIEISNGKIDAGDLVAGK